MGIKKYDLTTLSDHAKKQMEIGCKLLEDYDKGLYHPGKPPKEDNDL